jgi:hypothetical protein
MTVKELKLQKKLVGVYKQCLSVSKFDYKWWINPDKDYEELKLLAGLNVIREDKKFEENRRKNRKWNINTIRTKSFNKANKHFHNKVNALLTKAQTTFGSSVNSKSSI